MIDKIAWIELKDGKILSTRSKGKDTFYIPGGKREAGETDEETLVREIREELDVDIDSLSISPVGVFEAQAHGHKEGLGVKMTCYKAGYKGKLSPNSEIEEIRWLGYRDQDIISPVDKIIFQFLYEQGQLN